jgi:hypothetical protein
MSAIGQARKEIFASLKLWRQGLFKAEDSIDGERFSPLVAACPSTQARQWRQPE